MEKKIMPDNGRGSEVIDILISYEDGLILKYYYTKNKMNILSFKVLSLKLIMKQKIKILLLIMICGILLIWKKFIKYLDLHSYQNVLYKYAFLITHLIS